MSDYPIRPKPDDDPRFTLGLIVDVRAALAAHGFHVEMGPDFVRLQLALFRFLYGGPDDDTDARTRH